MSGETEQDVSSWTVDSLHELMRARFAAERDHTDGRADANRNYIDVRAAADRDYVNTKIETVLQRFDDVDKATELLSATVTAVPTDLQKTASDLLRLMDERDRRIEDRFGANALLSQTESSLNQTALAAALAAQEKAAAVQVDTFSSLIRGLGERIDRTIDKNAELASVASNALSARVTALGEQANRLDLRISEIAASRQAGVEHRTEARGVTGTTLAVVGVVVSLIAIVAPIVVVLALR